MANYTVLYHKTMRVPYPEPKVVHVSDYTEVGVVAADCLEDLFREMNAVDGTETCVQLHVRSMSVGDVAVDESGAAFYCASCGWSPVVVEREAAAS